MESGERLAAQLYVRYPGNVTPRAIKTLQAFAKPFLQLGETRVVNFRVPLAALRWRDPATGEWKLESGTHCVLAGGSSDDAELLVEPVLLAVLHPPRHIVWEGGLPARQQFRGEHHFTLEEEGSGTLFRHYEHFTGSITSAILASTAKRSN